MKLYAVGDLLALVKKIEAGAPVDPADVANARSILERERDMLIERGHRRGQFFRMRNLPDVSPTMKRGPLLNDSRKENAK